MFSSSQGLNPISLSHFLNEWMSEWMKTFGRRILSSVSVEPRWGDHGSTDNREKEPKQNPSKMNRKRQDLLRDSGRPRKCLGVGSSNARSALGSFLLPKSQNFTSQLCVKASSWSTDYPSGHLLPLGPGHTHSRFGMCGPSCLSALGPWVSWPSRLCVGLSSSPLSPLGPHTAQSRPSFQILVIFLYAKTPSLHIQKE